MSCSSFDITILTQYHNFYSTIVYLLCRKPKLPIEMEFQPTLEEPTFDGEDPLGWNSDQLFEHVKQMVQVKEKVFEKAKKNIDEAQRKDKLYYDQKHADPKVYY